MKNSFYFPHYYNFHQTEDIQLMIADLGIQSYGIYWVLIESMALSDSSRITERHIKSISMRIGIESHLIKEVIDYCVKYGILLQDDSGIFNADLIEHKLTREKLSQSGKRGALIKQNNSDETSHPTSQAISHPFSTKKEIKKEKERKTERENKETKETKYEERDSISHRDSARARLIGAGESYFNENPIEGINSIKNQNIVRNVSKNA